MTRLPDFRTGAKFREELDLALRHARSNDQISMLCLDLDRFKEVNDSLGHPAGDELLREVASRLSACLRERDMVCRLGGDEFAIVQFSAEVQASEASSLAARLIEAVEAPYVIQGHQLSIGVSIGISLAPADGDGPDQIMKSADLALYRAKSDGRGTYRFFRGRNGCARAGSSPPGDRFAGGPEARRIRGLLPADPRSEVQPHHLFRGPDPLVPPAPRHHPASRFHSSRGGDGIDYPDRRMGTSQSLHGCGRLVAAGSSGGEFVSGAVQVQTPASLPWPRR